MSLGPEGTHMCVKVNEWHRRFFLALVSMTLVNGYLAYNRVKQNRGEATMDLSTFKYELGV